MSAVQGVGASASVQALYTPHRPPETAPGFGDSIDALLRAPRPSAATGSRAPAASGGIQFSAQAAARLEASGVTLDPDDLAGLGSTVDQLARQGARDSLVLLDDHAFVVRVPDRTVTSVMTRREAAQNVFSQVDSIAVVG